MAYPIKDFRDSRAYPEPLNISAWRWEFLRRCSDYQEFYEAHKGEMPPPYSGQFGVDSLHDPMYDRSHEIFNDGGRLVGLPTFTDAQKWLDAPWFTPERALHSMLNTHTMLQSGGKTLAVIDLTLPLDLQLEQLKRDIELKCQLDGLTPVLKTNRRQEWPVYLRILDARAEGLQPKAMAPILYPEEEDIYPDYKVTKKIAKALQRAEHLCKTFARKAFDTEKK